MEMSVSLIVVLVIALILLAIGYFVVMPLIGVGGEQSVQAALNACCTKLVTMGQCAKDADGNFATYSDITCTVHQSIDASGQMSLLQLVAKAGMSGGPQTACCR